jgi:hypothetical protein
MSRAGNHLDDRLYPVNSNPPILQGTYRGRRKRIFNYQQPGEVTSRSLVSSNGWHRIIVKQGDIEIYRTPASRDRKAMMALLGNVVLHSVRTA